MAEADGAAAGFHGLLAVRTAHDIDAGGADVERSLFDDDVAAEGGGLVFLVQFALVGFDFDRLLAVAFQRVRLEGNGQQAATQAFKKDFSGHRWLLSLVRAAGAALVLRYN